MKCSVCGEKVEACQGCGQDFEKGDDIICDDEHQGHKCDSMVVRFEQVFSN